MPLAVNLLDSLISYWELEQVSGSRFDSQGSNTLADNNTVTQQSGQVYNAAEFVAANQEYLSIADNPSLSMGAGVRFTIAGWFYLTNVASGGPYAGVAKASSSGEYEYIASYYNRVIPGFQFYVSSNGTSFVNVSASTFGAATAATWYFVVNIYDGANIKISVNNGAFNTTAFSADVTDRASEFRLGRWDTVAETWGGRIDQVGIWKRVLTASEITILYNSGFGLTYAALVDLNRISHKLG